ncbi:MAG: ABC transporter ATP-binding protein [Bifidobacteriaceae bacterium]|jgi:peptide/nickel transport system ATP-binding protein|nr:ABC transporter ATP-binding protein [Bifidobacteriaceae bacterium]
MSEVVEIKNLSISFASDIGEVSAVHDINFNVGSKEIVAIVGESGSGKTVTSQSILAMLPSSATVKGVIVLSNQEGTVHKSILDLDAHELQRVRGAGAAMVFQEPSSVLNPVYTVGWQIAEALRAHGNFSKTEIKQKVIEIMKKVGIHDAENRYNYYPHEFSGGQKQRIVIAMALVLEPELIIADEPTTALDVTVQAEILELLRLIRDEFSKSVLLITHNMGVVADLADKVVVMSKGKVVETGDVNKIFYHPEVPYTQELMAAIPRINSVVEKGKPPDYSTEPLIKVSNFSVTYPGSLGKPPFYAVKNIDFRIYKDEVLGLVGESGSGKTTTGRALVGLTPISGGEIDILGLKLKKGNKNKEYKKIREKIGFVFQDPATSFNPLMTIGQCIAEPLLTFNRYPSYNDAKKHIAELLDQVDLSADYASRFPHELSGGQRQRAGFARALALEPELLIADEPTSALDVKVQAKVLNVFRELQEAYGFACLFITHDLAVVHELADRIMVMQNGELLETGTSDEVIKNPQHNYTKRLIASLPIPDPRAQKEHRELLKRLREAEEKENT